MGVGTGVFVGFGVGVEVLVAVSNLVAVFGIGVIVIIDVRMVFTEGWTSVIVAFESGVLIGGETVFSGAQETRTTARKAIITVLTFTFPTFDRNKSPNGLAHLPPIIVRRDSVKPSFLPNYRRIPTPKAVRWSRC